MEQDQGRLAFPGGFVVDLDAIHLDKVAVSVSQLFWRGGTPQRRDGHQEWANQYHDEQDSQDDQQDTSQTFHHASLFPIKSIIPRLGRSEKCVQRRRWLTMARFSPIIGTRGRRNDTES